MESGNILDILLYSINPSYENSLMKKKFELIINAIDSRVLTRGAQKRATSSCKFWQLKLNLLCLLDDNQYFNNDIYQYLINNAIPELPLPYDVSYKCSTISDLFLNTANLRGTTLYKIVYNNTPIRDGLMPITSISQLPQNDSEYSYSNNETQVYSLCIYPDGEEPGNIFHFFTLISKDNKYYINSSYGSEYVCIPQYTTEIDVEIFNRFCQTLLNINDENNKIFFINFLNKYFLQGGYQQRLITSDYDDWTREDRQQMHKYLPLEIGKNEEINVYFNPRFNYKFNIGLIKSYKSDLLKYINEQQQLISRPKQRIRYHPYTKGGKKHKKKTIRKRTNKKHSRKIRNMNRKTKKY